MLGALNAFKAAFDRPLGARFDVVLLGGALGSLFSALQAVAAPLIGALSDRYGRRTALLWSMAGNMVAVALWAAARRFPVFVASRVVGGLSEGNVQLAIAIAADVSPPHARAHTLALVGVAFSIAFTLGPLMGAALAAATPPALPNPFLAAALFSLALLAAETVFLYCCLPETRPAPRDPAHASAAAADAGTDRPHPDPPRTRTDESGLGLLKATHLAFLLVFSGMEFSLPFMTYDLFNYSSAQNGRVLAFVGLLAALLQAGFSRRVRAGPVAKTGLVCAAVSFFLLARARSTAALYVAAAFLAVTSACVVTALNTLASLRVPEHSRGRGMGDFRSAGIYFTAPRPCPLVTIHAVSVRLANTLDGAMQAKSAAQLDPCCSVSSPARPLLFPFEGGGAHPPPGLTRAHRFVVLVGRPRSGLHRRRRLHVALDRGGLAGACRAAAAGRARDQSEERKVMPSVEVRAEAESDTLLSFCFF